MNNGLVNLNFQNHLVRIVEKDGEPWFVAKDVAEALGYVWAKSATIRHVPEEWKTIIPIEGAIPNCPPKNGRGVNSIHTLGGNYVHLKRKLRGKIPQSPECRRLKNQFFASHRGGGYRA